MARPRISIVMPVWNGAEYLRPAVESVLGQTLGDFELIVVDDGSTDITLEILQSYSDPRLKVHRLDHGGIVNALNFGLAQARAGWIARHDADDISLPHRLERQWNVINRRSDAVLCHTDVELIGEGAASVGRARFPRTRSLLALRLCYQSPIVHGTVLFKKETAAAVGNYLPDERHAEDFSLWGRMLERGDFIGLPEKLLQFRVHPLSVSKRNLEAQASLATNIGVRHCQRFMSLSESDAQRANTLLRAPERQRRDWFWFLARCAPRLRWKSAETIGWLLWQTLKALK